MKILGLEGLEHLVPPKVDYVEGIASGTHEDVSFICKHGWTAYMKRIIHINKQNTRKLTI